jgi:hypothetical protein
MKKLLLLSTLASSLLFTQHAFAYGATVSLSDYHLNESDDGVNEVGIKLGITPAPIHLNFISPRLTYEPDLGVAFLRYHGSLFSDSSVKLSSPSLHVILDNNLAYKFYESNKLSLSGYVGLHYFFRDIDPTGEHNTIENYLEPRVGLRGRYSFTDKDSVQLEVYRPIKVWQYTAYGTLNPKPTLGYKAYITHEFNKKYSLSLYGEYTLYRASDVEPLRINDYVMSGVYQPRTQIIQAGVALHIKF